MSAAAASSSVYISTHDCAYAFHVVCVLWLWCAYHVFLCFVCACVRVKPHHHNTNESTDEYRVLYGVVLFSVLSLRVFNDHTKKCGLKTICHCSNSLRFALWHVHIQLHA